MIAVDARGENMIVVSPGANARVDARDVAAAAEVVRGAEVVLAQHEVPQEAVAAAIATAGGTVVLNPAPARGLAAPVDVLVPNRGELETLAGGRGDPVTLARSITGARAVVVTLGAEGAVVIEGDHVERVRAPQVQAVDTTGAGDAFCGRWPRRWPAARPWSRRPAGPSGSPRSASRAWAPRAGCRGARTCRRASSLIEMSVDSPEELEGLRRAGALAARVLREVRAAVAPALAPASSTRSPPRSSPSKAAARAPSSPTASRARSASASATRRSTGSRARAGSRPATSSSSTSRSSSTATSATRRRPSPSSRSAAPTSA